MDSKLKRKVVAVAVVMVLLVVATVFGANYIKNGNVSQTMSGAVTGNANLNQSTNEANAGTNNFYVEHGLDPTKDPYAYRKDKDFFDPVAEEQDPG